MLCLYFLLLSMAILNVQAAGEIWEQVNKFISDLVLKFVKSVNEKAKQIKAEEEHDDGRIPPSQTQKEIHSFWLTVLTFLQRVIFGYDSISE